jgi:pimeloyl-ACP methyl ester carboxylesterase
VSSRTIDGGHTAHDPRRRRCSIERGLLACCLTLAMPVLAVAGEAAAKAAAALGPPEDLAFKAEFDGSTQHYVRMEPKGATNPTHDVLICLHGHGADRWQYVKDRRDECRAPREFAAAHGMTYISPDYRASTSWMGPAAEADMVQLIGILRKEHEGRRIFLNGGSMGGTSVLIFAALHPELIAGVASLNGTANMVEYNNFQVEIWASYGGNKVQKADEFKKFTMPVAFTVGGKDRAVPPDSVRRLAAALERINKENVLIIDREDVGHSTNHADTMAALEFMLKAADTQAEKAKSEAPGGKKK